MQTRRSFFGLLAAALGVRPVMARVSLLPGLTQLPPSKFLTLHLNAPVLAQAWREHDDPLREFLEDWCETGPGFTVTGTKMIAAYQQWAREHGESFPLSPAKFTQRLGVTHMVKGVRALTADGKLARTWRGIALKPEAAR